MMPTVVIGGLEFKTYDLMLVVGMLTIVVICVIQSELYCFKLGHAILSSILINIFCILGMATLNYLQTILADVSVGFMGTLLFTPIYLAIVTKLFKLDVLLEISYSAIPIASMGTCMKIGCFLNGCCGGIVLNGVEFPVQLLEAGISLVIVVVLFILQRKSQNAKNLFAWYMVMYSVTRFFIEYLRDTPKNILSMSMGQVTSLVVLVLGIAFLVICKKMSFKQSN